MSSVYSAQENGSWAKRNEIFFSPVLLHVFLASELSFILISMKIIQKFVQVAEHWLTQGKRPRL